MSEIKFSAELDTGKLDAAIKQSNKTVGEWVRGVEKGSQTMDNAIKKTTREQKEAIKQQLEFIKGLEREIRQLEQLAANVAPGKAQAALVNEVTAANRTLTEAKADLNRLQGESISQNSKEEQSVETLTQSITKWALSLGGAAMALRLIKEAILATTTGINAFNIAGAVARQIMANLVSGSVNLTNGIQGVIVAQKQLNALRLQEKIDLLEATKQRIIYNQKLVEAHDQLKTGRERINAYDDALEAHNKRIDIETKSVEDRMAAIKKLAENNQDNEKMAMEYMDLRIRLASLDAERFAGQKEISSMRSGLIKKEIEDEIEWRKDLRDTLQRLADEQIYINNSVAEQEKLLQEAVISGTEAEINAIAKRILKLKEEEDLRRRIAKSAIERAEFGDFVPTVLPTGTLNIAPLGPKTKSKTAQQQWDESQKGINDIKKLNKETISNAEKGRKKEEKETEDSLKRQIDLREQIVNSVADLVMQLGQALGLDQRSMEELGSSLDVFQKTMTGDWLGASVSLISGLVQLIPNEAQKFAAQIEHINFLIDQQQRLIARSERFGGGKEALAGNIELLKQQEAALWNRFRLSGGKGAHEIRMQIEGVQDALVDAELALTDFLAGGVTENTLADAIAQGMMDGADRGAEYLNDVLLDAVMNIFKEQLLSSPQMKIFSDNLRTYMDDQVLTPEEVERLKRDQLDIINANKAGFDALTGGLDLGNGPQPGLTGAISRQITEETGSELLGMWRRNVDDTRQIRDYSKIGVDNMLKIESNTFQTVVQLQLAVVELKNIVSNTKQVPTGSL